MSLFSYAKMSISNDKLNLSASEIDILAYEIDKSASEIDKSAFFDLGKPLIAMPPHSLKRTKRVKKVS